MSSHLLAARTPHWWDGDHSPYFSPTLWGLNKIHEELDTTPGLYCYSNTFILQVPFTWPWRESEMLFWEIPDTSGLSWQSMWYRVSWPSHAYSSLLAHGRWVIAWEKARQKWDFSVVFTNHSVIFNSVLLETREYFPRFWKVIPCWGRSPCLLLRALRIKENWNNGLSLYREAFWQLTLLFLHCALGNTWFLFWLSI